MLPSRLPGGGGTQLFQVGVCGPDFQSVGLRTGICLWKGGLVPAENFQIWGLVPAENFQIWGLVKLWAKIWMKNEAVEAKISKFSQKGVLWTDSFAWNGTLKLRAAGEVWKGGLQGRTSPYPFLGQCPPRQLFFRSFRDHSQTLVRGPNAKRGALKIYDPCKGALKKITTDFPLKIEFTCFSMGLTRNFHGKKLHGKNFAVWRGPEKFSR